MSALDEQDWYIFEQALWVQAEELAAADAACLVKPHMQYRERSLRQRNAQQQDIVVAADACDAFCNDVLRILQHCQWAMSASAVMLLNSLSNVPEERTAQLQLVHHCLRSWIAVCFLRPGTVLCLPALRNQRSTQRLFQSTMEFQTFTL
jgi:hypothetical protein